MQTIVDQSYWDHSYENLTLKYEVEGIQFKDIFTKYLSRNARTCFEVGCYPGYYLVYLGKEFGYTINGLDKTPYVTTRLIEFLSNQHVQIGSFYQADFLTFQPSEAYDVVCSFGFIEHFYNFREVLQHHIKLLNPGGILIITCPNFRGLQHLLHWILDRKNLKQHVLEAMDLKVWEEIISDQGLEILFRGYYRTFDFWAESNPSQRFKGFWIRAIKKLGVWVDKLNHPNRWSSPYMVCVAKRT